MHVVFPGSFDPITNGHLNIIYRCAKMFTCVDVVIADNLNKTSLFTSQERFDLLCALLSSYENVEIFIWNSLMVNFLAQRESNIIIRGVRSASDYDYEFSLAQINKGLGKGLEKGIETILIPTDEKFFALRSSVVKEIVMLGGDVSDKVPPIVLDALKKKIDNQ